MGWDLVYLVFGWRLLYVYAPFNWDWEHGVFGFMEWIYYDTFEYA
jgi:hypothetical protein